MGMNNPPSPVVFQTASAASRVSPRSVIPNDSRRFVPISDDDTSVHPVPRGTGLRRIFTRVVKKGIRRGPDLVVVEADCLIAEFWARRKARARRSGRTIEEFSDSEDEDEEEMAIPNAVEPMSYPPVIIIDSDTEMEEDLVEDHDEPEHSNS
ncbi:hypothetical protein TanjilG_28631 [Lupinus angustifolius]|uniref:Uncharacterized protein n=1 Tax=Lupinus angustifolius TaxID=3871 RepID=A0A4P1RPE3_LUPAN|nr:hypothetical protein TanjilG_28631 [Lupinus angustifolius]